MSFRENLRETFSAIKKEYNKVDSVDKTLDIISLTGFVLFLISFISVFIGKDFNSLNIPLILYPLGIGGIATALRMKKRDNPEDVSSIFKEWLILVSSITVTIIVIIIIALVLYLS